MFSSLEMISVFMLRVQPFSSTDMSATLKLKKRPWKNKRSSSSFIPNSRQSYMIQRLSVKPDQIQDPQELETKFKVFFFLSILQFYQTPLIQNKPGKSGVWWKESRNLIWAVIKHQAAVRKGWKAFGAAVLWKQPRTFGAAQDSWPYKVIRSAVCSHNDWNVLPSVVTAKMFKHIISPRCQQHPPPHPPP